MTCISWFFKWIRVRICVVNTVVLLKGGRRSLFGSRRCDASPPPLHPDGLLTLLPSIELLYQPFRNITLLPSSRALNGFSSSSSLCSLPESAGEDEKGTSLTEGERTGTEAMIGGERRRVRRRRRRRWGELSEFTCSSGGEAFCV